MGLTGSCLNFLYFNNNSIGGVDDLKLSRSRGGIGYLKLPRNIGGVYR